MTTHSADPGAAAGLDSLAANHSGVALVMDSLAGRDARVAAPQIRPARPIMPAAETWRCHVCGDSRSLAAADLEGWQLVSSDCCGWRASLQLVVCASCGTVQKVVDRTWRLEAAGVYRSYRPYHQAGGAEQKVVSPVTGVLRSRSEVVLERLLHATAFGPSGRMLDIGCGTGVMLRAFHSLRPGWDLAGYDRLGAFRGAIEGIAPRCTFHRGAFEAISGTYDFVSLFHSLEHMVDPVAFLRTVRRKLGPSGVLLVQVPDAEANPFDLMVVDHCTHFTARSLAHAAAAAGLENVCVLRHWAAKEISLVAGPGAPADLDEPAGAAVMDGEALCAHSLAWLAALAALTRTVRESRPVVGIFGTSVGGIWLHEATERRADFFVDEDLGRVGRQLLGIPILHPNDVPMGSIVISALPQPTGAAITARLGRPGVEYVSCLRPEAPARRALSGNLSHAG